MNRLVVFAFALLTILAAVDPAGGGERQTEHPYILWTPKQAAAIRKTIETRNWAKAEYKRMNDIRPWTAFVDLFNAQVMGSEKKIQSEVKYLLSFIGAGIGDSRRHTMYMHALRYDALHEHLTDKQRTDLEKTFRRHIRYQLDHPKRENRLSWLPNMQYPRMLSAHLMAAALGDEKLIREIWTSPNGLKWYFDEYLADGGLYFEEFGKISSCVGAMLLWCRAMDNLGLSEIGYDYKGKGGASMRNYVESLRWITYPRTTIPGGLPRYERVTMGDAKGSSGDVPSLGVFQHAIVSGSLPDGSGGLEEYFARNMNGRDHRNRKVTKLGLPHWFEMLHARYPKGGFDYFLAQMRKPGQDRYIPSLLWGLEPIDPEKVTPPPAPARVFPQRGFAMIRARQDRGYWESSSPAVAMQFAMLYVHYASDCFSLLGYHANNRPIYLNRAISAGYNGGPWDFSVRGHCGVVVDGEQAQPIGRVPVRKDFSQLVKFVSARGVLAEGAEGLKGRGEVRSSDQPRQAFRDVYTNMDLSRSLMLTDEYLFDVYWLADRDDRSRQYHWLVHAPGVWQAPGGWQESNRLQATLMNVKPVVTQKRTWPRCDDPNDSWIQIDRERSRDVSDNGLDLTIIQRCALDDVSQARLPKAWYDRGVGVRLRMAPAEGSKAYVFETPTSYRPGTPRGPRDGKVRPRPETGGMSVAVARSTPETMFVALHEPIEGGKSRIDDFRQIARTDDAVLVAVGSEDNEAGVHDRLMVRAGPDADKPVTLSGGGESFTFTGHGFVRIGPEAVRAEGNITAVKLRVPSSRKLVVNGKSVDATISDGVMTWRKD